MSDYWKERAEFHRQGIAHAMAAGHDPGQTLEEAVDEIIAIEKDIARDAIRYLGQDGWGMTTEDV